MPEIPEHIINAANNARETGNLIPSDAISNYAVNRIAIENSIIENSIRDVVIEENRRVNDRLNMATDPDLIQPRQRIALEQSIYEDTMRREGFDPPITRHMDVNGYSVPYHSSDRNDATNLALNNIREEVNQNTRIPDHLIRPNIIIPTEPPNNTNFRIPFDRIPFDRIHTPSYPINATPLYENIATQEIIIPNPTTPEKAYNAYNYALALNAPKPHLEPLIATNATCSFLYARHVLKGRFIAAEAKIFTCSDLKQQYINEFITPEIIKTKKLENEETNKQIQSLRSSIDNSITILDLP